ncbi:hypothetical protein LSH36_852g02021 [Paralvinella palmiformis]|uniref:Uncharacterized protein n=1 Tax=Paralvinella palmiformis TaxID=53620 RepID=A0AAD9IYK7_9ANNE|nr:hypothetical protein LSH36_852g02021 [Paralvinella palmiformis]
MAASICLGGFVSRNDRPEIIEALTMLIARRIGNAKGVKIEFGTQERFISNYETDSDRYKHRFVYFVYLGQTLLHAAYLPSMSTEDAQLAINRLNLTRPYTVYSEDSLTMARNLRRSFTLSLRSRVMKADVARFNDPLRQLKNAYVVHYATDYDGLRTDGGLLRKLTSELVCHSLREAGLTWCRCKSRPRFRHYVRHPPQYVGQKMARIREALNRAWQRNNTGVIYH